jgi:transposase
LGSRQTATDKHKKEVIYNLADRSFQSGTKRYQVAYSTQRRWLKELVQDELYNFSREDTEKTPFTLGIDEVSFAEHTLVTTIGNITKRRLKGILPSRRKDDLKKVLHRIPSSVKPYIREVVIDMCELYARAIKEVLPHSSIVVDHFHVIQDANRRIDEERCILQDIYKKKIPRYIFTKNKEDLSIKEIVLRDILLIDYPELKVFYETKERLRSMYKLSSKKDAQDSMRHIISLLVSSDNGYHVLWGRSLSRWKEYILNYFDHRSTNGFMEGMHNKMKLIKRISFGFRNKEVFIHKVMLSVLITGILLPQLML